MQTEGGPYRWTDNGDGSVTLNVDVVPGLYYAADSAGKMSVAERRTPVRGEGGRCGCRSLRPEVNLDSRSKSEV